MSDMDTGSTGGESTGSEGNYESDTNIDGGDQYGWGSEGGDQGTTGQDAVKQALRKFQFKDGDKVEEVEYSDWDQIQKDLQKARAADRRFQEAARVQRENEAKLKQFQQFMMASKASPEKLLEQLGINPHQWAEQALARKLQDQLMSPEEKQRAREQQELNHHREMQKRMQQQQHRAQQEQARAQAAQHTQASVIQAMQEVGMPSDPEVTTIMMFEAAKMLYADRLNNKGDRPPMSHKEAVVRVKAAYDRHISSMIRSMDADKLYDFLGQDNIKKVRGADLARVKKAGVSRSNPGTSATTRNSAPKQREIVDERGFRERLEQMKRDPRGR